MATRLELRNMVKRVFKRTDKDTEIDEAINETLKEMAGIIAPRKLEDQVWVPTVAGQEDYALPSNVLRIQHPVRLIDPSANNTQASHDQLRFMSKDEYDFWMPNPNASNPTTGRPWGYTIFKNCILLVDLPDKVYRLEMNIGGTMIELSADGDESIFHDQFNETIKAGALKRMFQNMHQWDDAAAWKEVYVNGHSGDNGQIVGGLKLLRNAEKDQSQAPIIVRNNCL